MINLRAHIFVFFLFFFLSFGAFIVWANQTQVAVYSQDIPPNLVCIKDTYPDAYLCSPDATVPWYLSSQGELALVQ